MVSSSGVLETQETGQTGSGAHTCLSSRTMMLSFGSGCSVANSSAFMLAAPPDAGTSLGGPNGT